MKKELQELGLLNTKTLTKLVFYNERLAFCVVATDPEVCLRLCRGIRRLSQELGAKMIRFLGGD